MIVGSGLDCRRRDRYAAGLYGAECASANLASSLQFVKLAMTERIRVFSVLCSIYNEYFCHLWPIYAVVDQIMPKLTLTTFSKFNYRSADVRGTFGTNSLASHYENSPLGPVRLMHPPLFNAKANGPSQREMKAHWRALSKAIWSERVV
jgi:hypothetical protein